jgi:plastocyanin
MLSALFVFGACSKNTDHLDPAITADKITLAVGETITFTATSNSVDFACADLTVHENVDGQGEVVFEDTELDPANTYTYSFTPTKAGDYYGMVSLWVKCQSNKGDHVTGASIDFTVTE